MGVAKREDSYGPKSGPKAGSRASSPGEQAAACDYQTTRALGRGASRSLRLQKNSSAGLNARATAKKTRQLGLINPRATAKKTSKKKNPLAIEMGEGDVGRT